MKVLAQFFGKLLGRDLDPMTNVMVTVGAYQALFCCFQAFVEEGDEVSSGLGLLHSNLPLRALPGCRSARGSFPQLFCKAERFQTHSPAPELPKERIRCSGHSLTPAQGKTTLWS